MTRLVSGNIVYASKMVDRNKSSIDSESLTDCVTLTPQSLDLGCGWLQALIGWICLPRRIATFLPLITALRTLTHCNLSLFACDAWNKTGRNSTLHDSMS